MQSSRNNQIEICLCKKEWVVARNGKKIRLVTFIENALESWENRGIARNPCGRGSPSSESSREKLQQRAKDDRNFRPVWKKLTRLVSTTFYHSLNFRLPVCVFSIIRIFWSFLVQERTKSSESKIIGHANNVSLNFQL